VPRHRASVEAHPNTAPPLHRAAGVGQRIPRLFAASGKSAADGAPQTDGGSFVCLMPAPELAPGRCARTRAD
jgi:hypothetical protein